MAIIPCKAEKTTQFRTGIGELDCPRTSTSFLPLSDKSLSSSSSCGK